jgi:membrane associated rhomboid family serine protease
MQTQVLVLAIFFRKTTPTPALEAAGLISAVIGLVLFLEGLRVAIMPMAMLVGTQLPQRLKLPLVLIVAFCLGVLVTYAEPAIAAIRWAVPGGSESRGIIIILACLLCVWVHRWCCKEELCTLWMT